MHFDNFVFVILIFYIFILPLYVCWDENLKLKEIIELLFFDFVFLLVRVFDLLLGSKNSQGEYEHRLSIVVLKNLSYGFFFEIIYILGPFFYMDETIDSITYGLFKIPRILYLFNMPTIVTQNLEYYCKSYTAFEIRKKQKWFDKIQFMIQTFNCFHLLACT